MNRRKFLTISLPATGAVYLAPGMINLKAQAEIYQQFSGESAFDTYDLVINGAGLSGYFAALHAAKSGKKVLIVEKRTSPGFELYAKRKMWMHAAGIEQFDSELSQLFLPEGEIGEIKSTRGEGQNSSLFDDELTLFSGSIRKGMLRNLLVHKVHVLLMTDVCGIFTDKNTISGVLLASKHGFHSVNCTNFIDASDQVLFSRDLLNQPYRIKRAGFVMELTNVQDPKKKVMDVSPEFGLYENKLYSHHGKLSDEQLYLEFEFAVGKQDLEEIEQQARHKAAQLGKRLKDLDGSFSNAQIYQYGMETSLVLEDDRLPEVKVKGHYLLPGKPVSGPGILAMEQGAKLLIQSLSFSGKRRKATALLTVGEEIPIGNIRFSAIEEPLFSIPLKKVSFDYQTHISKKEYCQVSVAGGGTGGAFVAKGAAEKGANTIVTDYFNDLGGTKTMGGVMGYYHGVTDNGFFKKQNEEAEATAFENNMTKKIGRKYYHLKELLNSGARFIPGAILCGAVTEGNTVKGVVICRNGTLQTVNADITVDATGDGDIAFFAGASYGMGNSRTGETQNYSQWDIAGAEAVPSSPTNRDYDILDNTKISELQRGLFLSHYEAHFYDFHPFLTVRESRRIEGNYSLDLFDVAEGTHFEDVISLASSDFDPHNVGSSEFSKCGFLLPHSNDVTVEIPYRCLVPKTIDGLLISGRGISQTNNALQFTRMTADIIVLGYLTGQIAADLAWNNMRPRDYNVSALQKEWASQGYLPADYTKKGTENNRFADGEVRYRIEQLSGGKREYLYECSRLPKEKALPVLREYFALSTDPESRLLLAKGIAWFGGNDGMDLIAAELLEMFGQELKDGYPEGYVDNYDFIRGRDKNVLEGLFWRINQNIGLLAMTGDPGANDAIQFIMENTVSGGGMVERTNDYYNGRIDLRIIPFYNRILNLCFYADRIPDQNFIPAMEKLLKDENIGGFKTVEYDKVRWRVYGGFLELSIAATLARCGSELGYRLLTSYIEDIHYNYKRFAVSELKDLTKEDFGFNPLKWKNYLSERVYPRQPQRLVKALEV
ncbi:FAD-dependent oxidoreductase [Cyclobacterium xiamenense]|uniref:FAD-dependent oxidoreductase n=1 Tax=Cyclobacterium xiamenense TaxID=1297121 RepID=UPI0012B811FB|nr:FAD-dependent oxidoreductase [Cyclobacterium xiamenense]